MRPNIIIFNPDQMRRDVLGHLGSAAGCTPHLDRLVQSGEACSFSNAFCQNPVCTPSRCSFMTGWYPYTRGHRTMFYMLQPDEPCVLSVLKNEGYRVWWCGKNDLVAGQNGAEAYCDVYFKGKGALLSDGTYLDKEYGFESARGTPGGPEYYSFYMGECTFSHVSRQICDEHGRLTEQGIKITPDKDVIRYRDKAYLKYADSDWETFDRALELIDQNPENQPFCLYLTLTFPHPPYGVEEPFFSMPDAERWHARVPGFSASDKIPSMLTGIAANQGLHSYGEARFTRLRQAYLGMCARIDYQFDLLVQKLIEKGIYDDTAIFFFSDHGDFTGDYGLVEKTQNTFQDCLVNIPLIIKPPRGISVNNKECKSIVELIDVTETLYSIAKVDPHYTRFGFDLLPLITGEKEHVRDFAIAYGGRNYGETQASEISACSKTMPYMPRLSLQVREDGPYHTKAVMIRDQEHKYVFRQYEKDEFYCLLSDPQEQNNQIDEPQVQPLIEQYRAALLRKIIETMDFVPERLDAREIMRNENSCI